MENEEQEQPKTFEDLMALSETNPEEPWFATGSLWLYCSQDAIGGDTSLQETLLEAYLKEFHGFKVVAKVTRNVGYDAAWLDHINRVAEVVCAIDAALTHQKTTTKDGKETTTSPFCPRRLLKMRRNEDDDDDD